MTDKERLEEIETKYSTLTLSSEKNSTEYTEVDVEDLVFLIQNSFKQAERAQELEEEVDRLNGALHYQLSQENIRNEENRKLKYKNKRYREALEFYGDKGTYEVAEILPPTDEYQQPIEPVFKTVPIIYHDNGITARKALESDEW